MVNSSSRKTRWLIAAAVVGAMPLGPALAATPAPPPGASSCSGCHPANARVGSPVPQLVGQPAAQIIAAMTAFSSGTRPATVDGPHRQRFLRSRDQGHRRMVRRAK